MVRRQTLISSPPSVMKWQQPIRGRELEVFGSAFILCCPPPPHSGLPPVLLRFLPHPSRHRVSHSQYHSSSFSQESSVRVELVSGAPHPLRHPLPPVWPVRCHLLCLFGGTMQPCEVAPNSAAGSYESRTWSFGSRCSAFPLWLRFDDRERPSLRAVAAVNRKWIHWCLVIYPTIKTKLLRNQVGRNLCNNTGPHTTSSF